VSEISLTPTSIVQLPQSEAGSTTITAHPTVAYRVEPFSPASLGTPDGIARALFRMQRYGAEATQAARSLPLLGGTYFPNVSFPGGTAVTISHRVQGNGPVTWLALRIRGYPNVIYEISQNLNSRTIHLEQANGGTTTICDLWFFTQPIG